MTDIEAKALALVNEVLRETESTNEPYPISRDYMSALCRAIEQHEAFRQEVSDAVEGYLDGPPIERHLIIDTLRNFIIPKPKPKPDPLLGIVEWLGGPVWGTREEYVKEIHKALDARGLEIREKGQ